MTSSPPLLRRLLPLALLLGGCSPGETNRFFEGMAEIILVAMMFMAVMACIGVVLIAVQLLVVVLNFVRPSVASMVTGYVFAGLHVFSVLGSVAMMVSAPTGAPGEPTADTETLVNAAVGLVTAVALGALLAGSSYYAQRRLDAAKGPPASDVPGNP